LGRGLRGIGGFLLLRPLLSDVATFPRKPGRKNSIAALLFCCSLGCSALFFFTAAHGFQLRIGQRLRLWQGDLIQTELFENALEVFGKTATHLHHHLRTRMTKAKVCDVKHHAVNLGQLAPERLDTVVFCGLLVHIVPKDGRFQFAEVDADLMRTVAESATPDTGEFFFVLQHTNVGDGFLCVGSFANGRGQASTVSIATIVDEERFYFLRFWSACDNSTDGTTHQSL
jgi:hypothetical protein